MHRPYSRAVPLSRPYKSSRDQRPGGSGLTFVQGNIATPIRPIYRSVICLVRHPIPALPTVCFAADLPLAGRNTGLPVPIKQHE